MVEAMHNSAAVVAARHHSDDTGIQSLLEFGDPLGIVVSLADLVIILAARAKLPIDTLITTMRAGADNEHP
ncbi:hypothetical protein ACFO5K_04360 [Nocardia halotolerans]|uniref:Uncharacterized protein n=1 Tax=Nocardia halotolerans TaxID=1755878 RepID=A0ABV8VCL0_9NOCA